MAGKPPVGLSRKDVVELGCSITISFRNCVFVIHTIYRLYRPFALHLHQIFTCVLHNFHSKNMSAPTRTLFHTYNRHDHDHHHDHDHDHDDHHHHHHHIITSSHHHIITSSHHHIMIIIILKFATPYEQYVGWGNTGNINFIFMRGQNSPPAMNNMLIEIITSTISPWGIKIRHPLWTICWLG